MKDFEKRIFETLSYMKSFPESGIFQIEERHLDEYITVYGEIFNTKDKDLKRHERSFARKLAGRNFVRFLVEDRHAKFNDINAGMVYMISNPSFPDHVKIGMTLDIIDRLEQYQTYDPFRKFKIEKYNFVLDRKAKERQILSHPDLFREQGEWIKKENSEKIFLDLTRV